MRRIEISFGRCIGILPPLLSVVLPACAPVSYDQTTDQQITSITQEGNQQITNWENALAGKQKITYDLTSYGKIEGDLKTLIVRLNNSPDSETKRLSSIAQSQVTLWEGIRQIQTAPGFTDSQYLRGKEQIFNYNMGLLTQYELVLKNGSGTSSAGSAVAKAQGSGAAASLPNPGN